MTYLLLPGLLSDEAVWNEVSPYFKGDVLVADYGEADSIEAMAQVALKMAPERFVLMGHSMGGCVALEVYRQAPERVSHLVLLDTGYRAQAKGKEGAEEATSRLALLELAKNEGMRALGQCFLTGMVHPDRLEDEALVSSFLAMVERKTPAIFMAQTKALLERPDATSLLRDIECPVLLICGREDASSPVSRHETMALLVPNGEVYVVEACGHMTTMEQPKAVAEKVVDWLAFHQGNNDRA